MTSGASAPASNEEPKHGDIVIVDGREAIFLYRRGQAATVRFKEGARCRVVPFAKLRWRAV